ncbi:hypothetical protein M409DRAFT_61159 [Zasmidium cellare ATCC 36951]|uniref:Uncharacterized protein n=1 Tax=Zasmidium cellare ATCC 36951 TaxID=1080233 RepID=A0A6A6BWK9_ZASCE|nr:uncharacterized protein M409DRAFT_61159 [Zasmidium cellare ATCC 36951]KAF2158973.1 hypothetical protein M409DRAFT_61159 [Zasmidium cellare ATCC 36951]
MSNACYCGVSGIRPRIHCSYEMLDAGSQQRETGIQHHRTDASPDKNSDPFTHDEGGYRHAPYPWGILRLSERAMPLRLNSTRSSSCPVTGLYMSDRFEVDYLEFLPLGNTNPTMQNLKAFAYILKPHEEEDLRCPKIMQQRNIVRAVNNHAHQLQHFEFEVTPWMAPLNESLVAVTQELLSGPALSVLRSRSEGSEPSRTFASISLVSDIAAQDASSCSSYRRLVSTSNERQYVCSHISETETTQSRDASYEIPLVRETQQGFAITTTVSEQNISYDEGMQQIARPETIQEEQVSWGFVFMCGIQTRAPDRTWATVILPERAQAYFTSNLTLASIGCTNENSPSSKFLKPQSYPKPTTILSSEYLSRYLSPLPICVIQQRTSWPTATYMSCSIGVLARM